MHLKSWFFLCVHAGRNFSEAPMKTFNGIFCKWIIHFPQSLCPFRPPAPHQLLNIVNLDFPCGGFIAPPGSFLGQDLNGSRSTVSPMTFCLHKHWECGLLLTQQSLPSYQSHCCERFLAWTLGHCFYAKFQGTHFKHCKWPCWNTFISLRWVKATTTYFWRVY